MAQPKLLTLKEQMTRRASPGAPRSILRKCFIGDVTRAIPTHKEYELSAGLGTNRHPISDSCRLWSLWDIMQRLSPEFFHALHQATAFHQMLSLLSNQGVALARDDYDGRKTQFLALKMHLVDLGWSSSVVALQRALDVMDRFDVTSSPATAVLQSGDVLKLANFLTQAAVRIVDDLGTQLVLIFSPEQALRYGESDQALGAEVAIKFPSAAFEIDEASKCLALNRSTASVFHLMRILEIGIKASGRCLGVADPIKDADRNWGVMLRNLKNEIERRSKASPVLWKSLSDKKFFEEVHVSLDAVRNVWRNATMHVENKYTPEEANHIFGAVGGFMRKLASRLDETICVTCREAEDDRSNESDS